MLTVPKVLGHLELFKLDMPDEEADSLTSAKSALVYLGTRGLSRRNILYWVKSVAVLTP